MSDIGVFEVQTACQFRRGRVFRHSRLSTKRDGISANVPDSFSRDTRDSNFATVPIDLVILIISALYCMEFNQVGDGSRIVTSVRPKTPIFLETVWYDQSVLENFAEEQQNLPKFDPEDFHEISWAMQIVINSA